MELPRPCTGCSHLKRTEIDEQLLNRTAIRDVAGQHGLRKSGVNRHRSQIGTVLLEAGQRRTQLDVEHGDDLLAQSEEIDRDLRVMLEGAKHAQSLGACLQVIDRMQTQLALRAQLLDRAHAFGEREFWTGARTVGMPSRRRLLTDARGA